MPRAKKKKTGDAPSSRRYSYSDKELDLGTPEQRLGDALVSGDKDVGDLMTLLSVMGSGEYVSPSPFNIDFNANESDYYEPRSTSRGRAYVSPVGTSMYQPPSKEEGEYQGSGRAPTRDDVMEILGSTTAKNSDLSKVARLLRDPAVLNYFMDLYDEAGTARKPDTVKLKNKEQKTSGRDGCNTIHLVKGKPVIKRDPSCKSSKSWQQ